MRRRDLIALAGGAAAWPLAVRAQQHKNLPIIGYLGATIPSSTPQRTAAFVQRLRELGWIEGRTIIIEYRWAEGSEKNFAKIASEFVRLKVNVIVTAGVPGVVAAKRATSDIPIVFAVVADPVGAGLVASLARPGGNVTGLSNQSVDATPKRLELLREVIPNFHRLAVIANVTPDPVREMRELQDGAVKVGVDVVPLEIRQVEDIPPAIRSLKNRTDALYVASDPLVNSNIPLIQNLAAEARLPTIYNSRDFVTTGGFMAYGPDFSDLFRRAADFVDKILRGANPSDIPVEQPSKFEFVINLTTARALGLTIPASVLSLADDLIE
jgi:putative tryptophan/tyrosine transport system substrate-binding protein